MNLSGIHLSAALALALIHIISLGFCALYTVQHVRVRHKRREKFKSLGQRCLREVAGPAPLLWVYVFSVLALAMISILYFLGLFASTITA